jgi:glycerol-3-phosphate dehydrogenase
MESFDLLIIGGGINGTAIARDAAIRGAKLLLVEKAISPPTPVRLPPS